MITTELILKLLHDATAKLNATEKLLLTGKTRQAKVPILLALEFTKDAQDCIDYMLLNSAEDMTSTSRNGEGLLTDDTDFEE